MNKLIKSEFLRMFKSGIFKLCMAFSVVLGIFFVYTRWQDIQMNPDIYEQLSEFYKNTDSLLFVGGFYIVFAIAVFVSVFVGTEYSDGTIRNKIIVGHTRHGIYLSKLIVCAAVGAAAHILFVLTVLLFGNLILGGTTYTTSKIITLTAVSTVTMLAATAFLLLLSMAVQSRAAGAIVCLLTMFIMLFASMSIYSRLTQPEYYDGYEYYDKQMEKTITVEGSDKNPRYITGEQRRLYEFLNNFLPTSQINQIMEGNAENKNVFILYDFIIIIATTGIGMVILSRKNLK